jgi:hypothetical protein
MNLLAGSSINEDIIWEELLTKISIEKKLTNRFIKLLKSFPIEKPENLNSYLYRCFEGLEEHICKNKDNEGRKCISCGGNDFNFSKAKTAFFKKFIEEVPNLADHNAHDKFDLIHNFLKGEYLIYAKKRTSIYQSGLTDVHREFPLESFKSEITKLIELTKNEGDENQTQREIWILQTYMPNLSDLKELLIKSLDNGIKVNILLMWGKSTFATNRTKSLVVYSGKTEDFSVEEESLKNLEVIKKIIESSNNNHNLVIKLYDCHPTTCIYRAGKYMLVGFFMHKKLALNTFQLELSLIEENKIICHDIMDEFDYIWSMGRDFSSHLKNPNWQTNDLVSFFSAAQ